MPSRRAAYTKSLLLPGLLPRFWGLFGSGFSHIALYMAHAYRAVRLLPPGHAYLQSENIGRFGIWQVIRAARQNLVFDKEHLDQIIIYYVMFVGIFLLFFQILIMLLSLTVKGASAAGLGAYWQEFFVTDNPSTDIAFQFLDRVFCLYGDGAPPLFNSNVVGTVHCSSFTPIHQAVHNFFYFYNVGIVAVAIIIGLYLVATIVAETSQSGVAFGRRFNRGITPIRLILAVSLLVPFSYGFNGAQHLTFRAAKLGSSLATNGWIRYVCAINGPCPGVAGPGLLDSYGASAGTGTPFGTVGGTSLVGRPNVNNSDGLREFSGILEFAYVMHTCKFIEEWVNRRDTDGNGQIDEILAYQVFGDQAELLFNGGFLTFNKALNNAGDSDIFIRVGIQSEQYKDEKGQVYPFCGEIVLNVKDLTTEGAMAVQEEYWNMLLKIWHDPYFVSDGHATAKRYTPTSYDGTILEARYTTTAGGLTIRNTHKDPLVYSPDAADLQVNYIDYYRQDIVKAMESGVAAQEIDTEWVNYNTETGWAGAGVWFNKIAQLNGSLASSVRNVPAPSKWPSAMEWVKHQRNIHDADLSTANRFNPHLSDDKLVEFLNPGDKSVSMANYYAQSLWRGMYSEPEANPTVDVIRSFFGLQGLFNMMDNVDVHPLVQLTQVGRSLVESAMMNFSVSLGTGILGIGIKELTGQGGLEKLAKGISQFSMQIAMIGLALGFILYYVVPFLPFIYFFFAVGGWVKSIFEAMVGLPLWALAHIRIDGEGIPGPAAMNGYYLIFDIFLRPLLIIFGMVAALMIFAAQVQVLHHIWKLVVTNVAGTDLSPVTPIAANETGDLIFFRDAFDQFMYTVIYTIVVFMMAMNSFKLIDHIPNSILRWIGGSVSTFSDAQEDAAQTMVTYMHMGSQKALGQVNSGIMGLMGRS